MVLGADVTHPAPGNVQQESIAALTGSLDADCSLYGILLYFINREFWKIE